MMKKTLASLVFASSLFACKPDPVHVDVHMPPTDVAKPGTMLINGSAVLEVAPDCADLTMTITADGGKPGNASVSAQQKEQDLVAALMKLGVESGDIKLSQLSLEPIYAPNREGWATLKVATYRASITVTVTTKKFGQIGDIMDAGAEAGATSLSSQFRRSDLPELKKKVRDMAIAAARDKANQTAQGLGIQLGRVVSVNENANGYMWNAQGGYFPQVANDLATIKATAVSIGGSMQPLTLDITIGYELTKTA
jgi:uncharacterized protein